MMDKVVCVDCVAGSFVFCIREWRDRGWVRGRNKTTGYAGERKSESWGMEVWKIFFCVYL